MLIMSLHGKRLARARLLTTYFKHYAGVVIQSKRGLSSAGFFVITVTGARLTINRAIGPS
jgi:hypothetical protein